MKSVPSSLPLDMEQIVVELNRAKTKEECLRRAYDILTRKYHGNRLKTLTRFFELFPRSIEEVWSRSGFQHCTNLNWLLCILLIQSGHFTEQDMRVRWTLLWYVSPHQFLQVKINDEQWINVDIWSQKFGIDFGDCAHGFHVCG